MKNLILVIALSLISVASGASADPVPLEQAGYFRTRVGDLEVIALSDGTMPLKYHALMANVSKTKLEALMKADSLAEPPDTSINAFLIKTDSKLILVDAGAGSFFHGAKLAAPLKKLLESLGYSPDQNAIANKLFKSLKSAGYEPQQIDAVLMTHLHGDHGGGLLVDGKVAFPNAIIYLSKAESDFWLSAENLKNAGTGKLKAAAKMQFEQAQEMMKPYLDLGHVKTFDGASSLFPGIAAIPLQGHTPGHYVYEIKSKASAMLFIGDVIHSGIQFKDPAITLELDVDSAQAQKSRAKILTDAASAGELIAGAHIAFPGMGHVVKTGAGYVFNPINYIYR